MKIDKFWTITSDNTEYTNDRSTRFVNKDAAIEAATRRLANKPEIKGVVILEAVTHVHRSAPPVEVTEIE